MDMRLTEAIKQALFIRSENLLPVKPGYVVVPPDIAGYVAELGHAIEPQKLGDLRVSPVPVYSVRGGEAALAFELRTSKQRELDVTRLELTNFVMLLNDYAQKIRTNAASVPRQTLERIVKSKVARATLRAAAQLAALGCKITALGKDGEVELQPPPIEDFATPADPETRDLDSAVINGCELTREAGCILFVDYEYCIKCPKASHDWAVQMFSERRLFSGRIIKSGGGWRIDPESPCTFSPRTKSGVDGAGTPNNPVGATTELTAGRNGRAAVKPKPKKNR